MANSLKDRVKARLDVLGINAFEAARRGGLERNFVNDILDNTKLSVRGVNLPKLATALECSIPYLLGEEDEPATTSRHRLPVRGHVGAGATIDTAFEQLDRETLEIVTVPHLVPPGAFGLEVRGDSMYPRYEHGDVVVLDRERQGRPLASYLNAEIAVLTADGQRLLKLLRQDPDSKAFYLVSHNAPPMLGVEIVRVWEVLFSARSHQIKREEPAVRRKAAAPRAARA
jgi:SOS-response transcriptional repressor LexA